MNNKIKYILAGILIISGILAVSAAVIRQPNDYYAFMGGFTDIRTSATDDDKLDVTFTTYYIPLTASQTYTLTVRPVTATVNISQPAQINTKIKTAINDTANSLGYNIRKIIMQSYTVSNP